MSILPYQQLLDRAREITYLSYTCSTLRWDMSTYMPPRAATYRSAQMAHLQAMLHRLFTAPEVGQWITACEEAGLATLSEEHPEISTNLRGFRRDYNLATKLPERLVQEMAQTTGEAYGVWVEARRDSDFSEFAPWLEKIVKLKQEEADRLGYEEARYDALLDQYEAGTTTRALKPLFATLQESLRDLVPLLRKKTGQPEAPVGPFPQNSQEALNAIIAAAVGFDFSMGRIDTTIHPFSTALGPLDHRILTRYQTDDFFVSLYGILHETGHGLYDSGLNPDWCGLPSGETISLGIHESQSRLWENQVGRSREFWNHWFPKVAEHFPDLAKSSSPEALWRWANRIQPSYIRVEADEATYHLHIALRFEVEQQLINGGLAAADVPKFWNERFEHLLGISVPDDAHGCLQDVHWCSGLFGYFPTYSLGSLNAAQLFVAAQKQEPEIAAELAEGKYGRLLAWLKTNIHQHGRRFTPDELMVRATGEKTNPAYFFAYLKEKFGIVD